jgi:hypothetical protein
MIETVTGVGAALIVSVFGFAWRLSGRLTHIEDKIDALPCHECPVVKPPRKWLER